MHKYCKNFHYLYHNSSLIILMNLNFLPNKYQYKSIILEHNKQLILILRVFFGKKLKDIISQKINLILCYFSNFLQFDINLFQKLKTLIQKFFLLKLFIQEILIKYYVKYKLKNLIRSNLLLMKYFQYFNFLK